MTAYIRITIDSDDDWEFTDRIRLPVMDPADRIEVDLPERLRLRCNRLIDTGKAIDIRAEIGGIYYFKRTYDDGHLYMERG